jgi:hypothetical protein
VTWENAIIWVPARGFVSQHLSMLLDIFRCRAPHTRPRESAQQSILFLRVDLMEAIWTQQGNCDPPGRDHGGAATAPAASFVPLPIDALEARFRESTNPTRRSISRLLTTSRATPTSLGSFRRKTLRESGG